MQPQHLAHEPSAQALNILFYAIPVILLATVALASGAAPRTGSASTHTENQNTVTATALTEPQQITNPDYVANPPAYLVDIEEKVSSPIPIGQALWVESVVDPTTVRVSYTVQQAGAQIIDVQNLEIPSLQVPLSVDHACWVPSAQSFLARTLLHRVVYLVRDSAVGSPYIANSTQYRLFMESAGPVRNAPIDVAMYLVSNGYGGGSTYELRKAQEVASLAGRGLWGTCKN